MHRTRASLIVAFAMALGCAGASAGGPSAEGPDARMPRPQSCVAAPSGAAARRAAIDEVGRRAFAAMRAGEPQRLLLDDIDLRVLLAPEGATRFAARRLEVDHRVGSTEDFGPLLGEAEYAGLCLQGARDEEAGGVLGLRADGWIFERLLVIGRRPTGQRVASWIEGTFVLTDRGFGALDLERVERPRWEHSDLEIAPCDLSIRDDLPEHAR